MKKTFLTIIFCLFIVIFCISLFFINDNEDIVIKKPTSEIVVTELKSSKMFNETIANNKFKIINNGELEVFKSLYKDFDIDEVDLKNNTIFIETRIETSSSAELVLEKVNIDGIVEFNIKANKPKEEGLTEMAYWYFIAIIPNQKLKNINTEEWKSPNDYIEYIG